MPAKIQKVQQSEDHNNRKSLYIWNDYTQMLDMKTIVFLQGEQYLIFEASKYHTASLASLLSAT